jgi:hypothetical protein
MVLVGHGHRLARLADTFLGLVIRTRLCRLLPAEDLHLTEAERFLAVFEEREMWQGAAKASRPLPGSGVLFVGLKCLRWGIERFFPENGIGLVGVFRISGDLLLVSKH